MKYPTIGEVNSAGDVQLLVWSRELPEPQTPVEQAARRRISKLVSKRVKDSAEELKMLLHAKRG